MIELIEAIKNAGLDFYHCKDVKRHFDEVRGDQYLLPCSEKIRTIFEKGGVNAFVNEDDLVLFDVEGGMVVGIFEWIDDSDTFVEWTNDADVVDFEDNDEISVYTEKRGI